MKFSDRIGATEPRSTFQTNGMDDRLRNRLYNVIFTNFLIDIESRFSLRDSSYSKIIMGIWHDIFGEPLDEVEQMGKAAVEQFRNAFFQAEWYKVYNIIEYIYLNVSSGPVKRFKFFINSVLKEELAGYQFVGDYLTPITESKEIQEVEGALDNTLNYQIKGAKEHLESSLKILSDKDNPDYRNAIKEAISAIESTVQILTGSSAEFGKAINILNKKIQIHGALKTGYKNLYGYTSDAHGIRHALTEEDNLDVEDARYMLISCSAFINYLLVKADKAGILESSPSQ
jgi:hypothetical protein